MRYTDYYRDVKDRLIKDEGNACGAGKESYGFIIGKMEDLAKFFPDSE